MEESTGWRDGVVFWVGHSKDTLVVLGALVVAGLTALTDGLADVSITERTHVTVLSALLGVLVRLQLSAESLDDTLPAVALGDGHDVGHVAFFKGVGERVFLAEVLFGPGELVVHGSAGEAHFHHVRDLGRDAGEGVGLRGDDEANLTQVGLLEVGHVLVSVVLFSLWNTLEKFFERFSNCFGIGPNFATGLHAVGRHFVATNAENSHLRAFDDGHRNSNFLAGGGATWVQITSQNVGHAGFPACKPLHSDFARIGGGPRLDVTKRAVRSLARAERH